MERTQGERTKPVDLNKQESFSVLLMGIDTGDLGRVDQGRSDTMMVATVSPEDKQTTIVSIPRDTYVDIVGHDTKRQDQPRLRIRWSCYGNGYRTKNMWTSQSTTMFQSI